MKKILFIIGSVRKHSTSKLLSDLAAGMLEGRAECHILDYTDVPWIDPDEEFPTPGSVARIRREIIDADGVWIFFPEHNYSYPGVLKNLLDWLSRATSEGASRKTAVSSGVKVTYSCMSGASCGEKAFPKMEELLTKMHMDILKEPTAGFGHPVVEEGRLILSEEETALLRAQAEAFYAFLDAPAQAS